MIQWETVEPETHYLTNNSRSATDRIEPARDSESRLRASGKRESEFVPCHQVFLLPVFNCFLLLQQISSFSLFSSKELVETIFICSKFWEILNVRLPFTVKVPLNLCNDWLINRVRDSPTRKSQNDGSAKLTIFRLTDWLTDWLTVRLIDWLTGWPTNWLSDWLTDWLTGWNVL